MYQLSINTLHRRCWNYQRSIDSPGYRTIVYILRSHYRNIVATLIRGKWGLKIDQLLPAECVPGNIACGLSLFFTRTFMRTFTVLPISEHSTVAEVIKQGPVLFLLLLVLPKNTLFVECLTNGKYLMATYPLLPAIVLLIQAIIYTAHTRHQSVHYYYYKAIGRELL